MTVWRTVQHLDRRLMRRSFLARSPALDHALVRITSAANYSRLWLVIAGGLALFGGQQGRRAAGRGLIAIAIAAVVANGPAKLLVRRRRPLSHSRPTLIRDAPVDIVSIRSHCRGVCVRHWRERRGAGTGACARSARGRRCLLTRAYRRSLSQRRRSWRRDRDRRGSAGHADDARRHHHFSSISSSRSSVSTSSSTLSCS